MKREKHKKRVPIEKVRTVAKDVLKGSPQEEGNTGREQKKGREHVYREVRGGGIERFLGGK